MLKISIIVPVYNTEKYLEKCLNSLIKQSLKDIEIICVNDGSTDNSAAILSEFSKKDKRIKVLSQKNQKQGNARNQGVKVAQGEYIGYVDSDDWVDYDFFEKLYNSAKKYKLDIALATNVRVGNGKTKKRLEITREKAYYTLQDKIDICKQYKNECPTNKIYRRDFLLEHNITWPEGVYCEDKLYTIQALFWSNGVVAVPEINYYYYRRDKSTVKNSKINKMLNDKELARRQVLDFLKEQKANIRDKDFWAIKSENKFYGFTFFQVKESLRTEIYYLFGFIPCFIRSI